MLPDLDWREPDGVERRPQRSRRAYLWSSLVAAAFVGLAAVLFFTSHDTGAPQRPKPPMLQVVTLPPPPPPPPPPKPPEKPPEPQKQVEAKPTQQPPPTSQPSKPATPKLSANPKPAGQPMTAALGEGANNYGLQVGNGGGSTIGGAGGDGPGSGPAGYGFYAIKVQSQLQAAIMRNDKTRRGTYLVVANLWLGGGGHIDRIEITQSSGNAELDSTLAELLKRQTISEPPPAGMPQPIRTKIAARG